MAHLLEAPIAVPPQRPRILLLKLGERIGDFVVAINAFRIIRDAFTQAEITLVCMPSIIPLAETTGLFDRVVGFSYVHDVMHEHKTPKMDKEDQIAAFKELINGHYLLAADFRYDESTRWWLDQVDASYRAGFASTIEKGLDIIVPPIEWNVPALQVEGGNGKNLPMHAEIRLSLLAEAIVGTIRDKVDPLG